MILEVLPQGIIIQNRLTELFSEIVERFNHEVVSMIITTEYVQLSVEVDPMWNGTVCSF